MGIPATDELLRHNNAFQADSDFLAARTIVAHYLYALIDRVNSIAQSIKNSAVRESLQRICLPQINECQKWLWDCNGYLDNRNNASCERDYKTRVRDRLPKIQEQVREVEDIIASSPAMDAALQQELPDDVKQLDEVKRDETEEVGFDVVPEELRFWDDGAEVVSLGNLDAVGPD